MTKPISHPRVGSHFEAFLRKEGLMLEAGINAE
jgi:hypothetical protein